MVKLVKFNNNEWSVRSIGATLFNGQWKATRAWCYWTLFIPLADLDTVSMHFVQSGDNVAWFDEMGHLISTYKAELK